MAKTSAGLLLYRRLRGELQVLLVHPGGPFWLRRDAGSWSIPKGEVEKDEDPFDAARREFREETGFTTDGPFLRLTPRRQNSGKTVYAWAAEGDCNPDAISSVTFMLEWPPRSGKQKEFPEVDRAGWFSLAEARVKILPGQAGFLDELEQLLHPQATLST